MNTAIESKLKILDRIYAIYGEFAASLDLACKKYCDHCCTAGVTLTTLEGFKIVERLNLDSDIDVSQLVQSAGEIKRPRPQLTTNHLAQLCAAGVDPPEADNPDLEACPLLGDHQCPIYDLRPFGCRCLVSRHNCAPKGYAEVDDFVLSVNTVFLQTIEHVDAGGCSGNLLDVLLAMLQAKKREAYCNGALHCSASRLIANQPLQTLMIPPEHRTKMAPILQQLREIKA